MTSDAYDTLVVDIGLVIAEIRERMYSIADRKALGAVDIARIEELQFCHNKLNEVV